MTENKNRKKKPEKKKERKKQFSRPQSAPIYISGFLGPKCDISRKKIFLRSNGRPVQKAPNI